MPYKMLDGNGAAVEAMRLAKPKVIAAYPITPQSSMAEKLSELVDEGKLDAKYVRVESEHSAMSVVIGAQLTGVRAATATSSVGLALMHEVCGVTSGLRLPVVMPVVNRSLVAPWSLWCDHQDSMSERDTGWIQQYASNVQEVLDLMLISYKVSENEEVLTPSMVCLDGFFLSHSMQKVAVPSDEEATEFIGEYQRKNMYIDPKDPMFVNDLTPTDEFTEMRYQQKVGFDKAYENIPKVMEEFEQKFGRKVSMVEPYQLDDADVAVVTIGSMSGTAKYVVNQLREKGIKAGCLKITTFRPFPYIQVKESLRNVKVVGVMDRSAGLGAPEGPLCTEIRASMYGDSVDIRNYIGGLAGRDISDHSFNKIFNELIEVANGTQKETAQWFDVKENAMDIREVIENV